MAFNCAIASFLLSSTSSCILKTSCILNDGKSLFCVSADEASETPSTDGFRLERYAKARSFLTYLDF